MSWRLLLDLIKKDLNISMAAFENYDIIVDLMICIKNYHEFNHILAKLKNYSIILTEPVIKYTVFNL